MNRRVRLVLFLAALAATGPMTSARTFEVARVAVSISWFRSDRATRAETQQARAALDISPERSEASVGRNRVRPHTLHSHSLFQRPPPLQG